MPPHRLHSPPRLQPLSRAAVAAALATSWRCCGAQQRRVAVLEGPPLRRRRSWAGVVRLLQLWRLRGGLASRRGVAHLRRQWRLQPLWLLLEARCRRQSVLSLRQRGCSRGVDDRPERT